MKTPSGSGTTTQHYFMEPTTSQSYPNLWSKAHNNNNWLSHINGILYNLRCQAFYSEILVPYFGGKFFPIFEQEKDEFLATTVETFFDENSSN